MKQAFTTHNAIKEQIKKTLQMFIELDNTFYGKVSDQTLEAIKKQGFTVQQIKN